MSTRWFTTWIGLLAVLTLPGCIGAALHGGRAVIDQSTIAHEEDAAKGGNAVAQYKVGDAYCCAGHGFTSLTKDNQAATYWFCQAARQDYGPAKLRLARIYAGKLVGDLELEEQLIGLVATTRENKPLSLMWARLGADSGEQKIAAESRKLIAELVKDMPENQREKADSLLIDWKNAPCEWRAVYPQA